MDFGEAIKALKNGKHVARRGWNGHNMWLVLIAAPPADASAYGSAEAAVWGLRCLPWIGMKTADGGFVPWLASQTDMLAEDWTVMV